jgi:predicted ribosomally synthesized peptide with SipW-like signal peptide
MRKSIILAVVVVVALVVAGTSGVFATWSDSEVSENNIIQTGALDLKVNGADDAPWGDGVPTKVEVECMVPGYLYGPFEVELWNAGICEFPSAAFIHFKDYFCFNVEPKINGYPETGSACWYENYGPDATTGYTCPVTGDLKPEPELVAEFGGKVDCTWVDGVGGPLGDTCSMLSALTIYVVDESGEILIGPALLGDVYCQEIYLFDLMPCEPRTIYLWFSLYQPSEEDFGYNYFLTPEELGIDPAVDPDGYNAAYMHWLKFNDWPSWAYMRDAVSFSMEFDLLLGTDMQTPGPA